MRTNRIALTMETGGNLVIYSSGDRAVWGAGRWGDDNPRMVLQADANLVIQDKSGKPIWATNTWR
ncbi:hypothetical protein [Actinoallomurus iriomotensis]|uniref:hypothetical protein n=1 Tax=Actinoallomurus iriomotensis TaxID=478107 RepID=UPI0025570474|nr:hypothetical protein [Actinoallomurus iriomotensis]